MSFQEKSASRKKTQGDAADILREVSLIGLANESGRSTLSSSDRENVYYFGGAQVNKRRTYTATSRQPRFTSLH